MLTLEPVDGDNWRDVAKLEVTPEQQEFVAAPTYYLCLCHYSPAGETEDDGQELVARCRWPQPPGDSSAE